jgi:hypothetical protein
MQRAAPAPCNSRRKRSPGAESTAEATHSNRDAIGVKGVLHTAEGEPQQRSVRGGSGFLSNDPLLLRFWLGSATRIEKLEVHWPSGATQTLVDLEVDRLRHLREHAAAPIAGS